MSKRAREREWVSEHKTAKVGRKTYNTIVLRPVFVRMFAQDLVFRFGLKVLIMSATILDPALYAKSLNIKPDELAFYRMPSNFPVKNRPIYSIPLVKVTGGKSAMTAWGPKLCDGIDHILDGYPGQRGIIHSHTFYISEMLMAQSRHRKRFLYQKNFRDKDELLEKHGNSADSIIVAPAMHEGLDLRDSLSRVQIICKVPFPNYFDDKQLSRRVELEPAFLMWITALKLVQSYGRSVRSDTDWADTYIIDSTFSRFVSEARRILPEWFLEAIIKV